MGHHKPFEHPGFLEIEFHHRWQKRIGNGMLEFSYDLPMVACQGTKCIH
jgi:hypothetical protein